ncbi:OB-fold protein [Duganella qianjiadongensis]|uniref:Uncharacterized protein n=1 Tax=Duganella qianjiadongensis TaxID=2692176 RepID=A0ABW9VSW5_9BURK|nr:hypothetical protein [Duganella qianjiadongensis]MYM42168.1 hypothetical protein [Duganella qianjiadongensis]
MAIIVLFFFILTMYLVFRFARRQGHSYFLSFGLGIPAFMLVVYLCQLFFSSFELREESLAYSLPDPVAAVPSTAPIVEVDDGILSAKQLFLEYQENEVAADLKYRDKRFKIKGIVHKIRKGVLGGILVDIATVDKEDDLIAPFEKEFEDFVSKLSRGDKVILECTGQGFFLGKPSLNDCRPE